MIIVLVRSPDDPDSVPEFAVQNAGRRDLDRRVRQPARRPGGVFPPRCRLSGQLPNICLCSVGFRDFSTDPDPGKAF